MKTVENTNTGWDDVSQPPAQKPPNEEKKDSLFARLEPREEKYRCKPVAIPCKMRTHFYKLFLGCVDKTGKPVKKSVVSPAKDLDQRDLDVAWKKGDYMPARRFAVPMIMRDSGKIQIVEGGPDVFDPIYNFWKDAGVNPSSSEGPDFLIGVKMDAKNPKKRVFSCSADPKHMTTPFTAEELKMIESFPEDWAERWYKKSTPEEIEFLWNQLPLDKKVNPKSKFVDKLRQRLAAETPAAPAEAQEAQDTQEPAPEMADEPPAEEAPVGADAETEENEELPF